MLSSSVRAVWPMGAPCLHGLASCSPGWQGLYLVQPESLQRPLDTTQKATPGQKQREQASGFRPRLRVVHLSATADSFIQQSSYGPFGFKIYVTLMK